MTADDPEDRLVMEALLLIGNACDMIDEHSDEFFFPVPIAERFKEHIVGFLAKYSELCNLADSRDEKLSRM